MDIIEQTFWEVATQIVVELLVPLIVVIITMRWTADLLLGGRR